MSTSHNTTTEVLQSDIQPTIDTVDFLPLVDWLAFTVPVDNAASLHGEAVLWRDILGGGSQRDRGMHGYTHGYSVLGSGMVLWRPDRLDMGVHVILPASALSLLPEYGDYYGGSRSGGVEKGDVALTPDRLIQVAIEAGAKFSRVDVCQDTSQVTIDQVVKALDSPELVTKSNKRRLTQGWKREDGQWMPEGQTWYVGGRTSDKIVRFYDKAAEQGCTDGRVWTRCEAEFKHHAAHTAALHLAGGRTVAELIVSTVDFREVVYSDETGEIVEANRRPQAQWWVEWLRGAACRVSFAKEKVEKTVVRAFEWVRRQVAPTLAFLTMTGVDARLLLHTVIDSGFSRVDHAKRQKAYAFRDAGLELIPQVPQHLHGVYDDLVAWMVNKQFMQNEAEDLYGAWGAS